MKIIRVKRESKTHLKMSIKTGGNFFPPVAAIRNSNCKNKGNNYFNPFTLP